jgi:hypothetical protein
MILNLILLAVFATVTLVLWKEGLWAALVMLLNVLLAATVATAWFEWLVAILEPRLPSYTYLLDFVSVWALFCLVLLLAREATDRLSRTRVKLRKPIELFGTPLVAALTGWVMTAFTAATLHTAPLPRDFVQPTPEARMFFGLAPDRRWLQWVRAASLHGAFANPGPDNRHAFDANADFILRYADRRARFGAEPGLRVSR